MDTHEVASHVACRQKAIKAVDFTMRYFAPEMAHHLAIFLKLHFHKALAAEYADVQVNDLSLSDQLLTST